MISIDDLRPVNVKYKDVFQLEDESLNLHSARRRDRTHNDVVGEELDKMLRQESSPRQLLPATVRREMNGNAGV